MKRIFFLSFVVMMLFFNCSKDNTPINPDPTADTIYFPPINSDTWETKSIADLNFHFFEEKTGLSVLNDAFIAYPVLSFALSCEKVFKSSFEMAASKNILLCFENFFSKPVVII